MKIVYRAGDITEAEIVKGMLLSNNIEAHVSGYYLQGGIGEMAPTDLEFEINSHNQKNDWDQFFTALKIARLCKPLKKTRLPQ